MFRYAYAFLTEECKYEREVFSVSASWRIVEITESIAGMYEIYHKICCELFVEFTQYDPVISMSQTRFWKNPSLEFACNALDVYLDWASNKQQWMRIYTSNVLEESKQKGKNLYLMTHCLSNLQYFGISGTQTSTLFFLQIIEVSILFVIQLKSLSYFSFFLRK